MHSVHNDGVHGVLKECLCAGIKRISHLDFTQCCCKDKPSAAQELKRDHWVGWLIVQLTFPFEGVKLHSQWSQWSEKKCMHTPSRSFYCLSLYLTNMLLIFPTWSSLQRGFFLNPKLHSYHKITIKAFLFLESVNPNTFLSHIFTHFLRNPPSDKHLS